MVPLELGGPERPGTRQEHPPSSCGAAPTGGTHAFVPSHTLGTRQSSTDVHFLAHSLPSHL